MAESDPSPKCNRVTMTIPEVHSLAKRLEARGRTMLTDVPEQQVTFASRRRHSLQ
jgi:hypothetical protein